MDHNLAIFYENTVKIKFNLNLSFKYKNTVSFSSVTNWKAQKTNKKIKRNEAIMFVG